MDAALRTLAVTRVASKAKSLHRVRFMLKQLHLGPCVSNYLVMISDPVERAHVLFSRYMPYSAAGDMCRFRFIIMLFMSSWCIASAMATLADQSGVYYRLTP